MSRKIIFAGAGLAAAVCCFALASSSDEDKPGVDPETYQEFMSHQVGDVYDLEQYFADGQYSFLPLVPPAEDFILRQPGMPTVLPFTWEKFPEQFVKGLVPEYENSVAVYPVTILEDPITRETVFLNADGEEIYALPAATGYDPYAYLKSIMPLLYSGKYSSDDVYNWQKLYDPARVQIRAKLIAPDDVEPYLYVAAKIAEEAALAAQEEGGGGMMLMEGESDSNIVFTAIFLTNGIGMKIAYPAAFTNRLEVYTCNDVLAFNWHLAATNLSTAGTNEITWINTALYLESDTQTAYSFAAGNADLDTDGDGLPDAREYFVYHTDPNNADTDGDGMNDGAEAALGTDPTVANAAATVTIRFPENGRRLP
jgi:hypothetical protein